MKAKLTITLSPHSKDEAANNFVTRFEEFRTALEGSIKEHGLLGIAPDQVDVRFLLDLPRFD